MAPEFAQHKSRMMWQDRSRPRPYLHEFVITPLVVRGFVFLFTNPDLGSAFAMPDGMRRRVSIVHRTVDVAALQHATILAL